MVVGSPPKKNPIVPIHGVVGSEWAQHGLVTIPCVIRLIHTCMVICCKVSYGYWEKTISTPWVAPCMYANREWVELER